MGYPVITVTEVEGGIRLRQDRFLDSGVASPQDNETIWCVLVYRYPHCPCSPDGSTPRTIPLNILTVSDDGTAVVNKDILLDEREKFIPLDTSKTFKLNADTTGFCESRLILPWSSALIHYQMC